MPKTAYDLSFADALPAGAVALATLRAQEAERAAEVQQGVHELGALAVLLEGEHDRFHREANMSLEWLTRDQPSGTVVYEELSQV